MDSNDDGKCGFQILHVIETSILKLHLAGKQILNNCKLQLHLRLLLEINEGLNTTVVFAISVLPNLQLSAGKICIEML